MQGMVGVPMMPENGNLCILSANIGTGPANDTGIHFLEGYCAHPSGSLCTLRELDVCQHHCMCSNKIEKKREGEN